MYLSVNSEIIVATLKNEDWLGRGVKNVVGLPRPVPYEIDLQQSAGFVDWAQSMGADPVSTSAVVVKLGSKGAVVRTGGRDYRVGIHEVDAKDTTGAGDAFAAGFLYGYVNGWDPGRSADLGARVASATVGQVGAVVRDKDVLALAVAAARG